MVEFEQAGHSFGFQKIKLGTLNTLICILSIIYSE